MPIPSGNHMDFHDGQYGQWEHGRLDVQKALAIINVAEGSPSEMSGLKVGSVLLILGIKNSTVLDW